MSISTDIINLEVQMTSNKAMSELNKLESETADLRKENERMAISRAKLKALGKEETEDYKKLSAALDVNRKKMKENESSMAALRRTVGITAMSMNDLKKRANELTGQLNSTSKAANPKEYARLEKELGQVRKQMNSLQSGASRTGSLLKTFGALLPITSVAAATAAVATMVKQLFNLSKRIQAEDRKALIVLGDSMGYVEAQADKLAKKIGVTRHEFTAMVTNTADLLIPLDFTRKKAAEMSVQIQSLAGAMDEWTAGQFGVADASNTLNKAVLGEMEELKKYGIAIRQDSEEFRNLVKEKKAAAAATDEQARALASLELIMKKSRDAQASFAGEGNELIRWQKSVSLWWRQMKENVVGYFETKPAEKIWNESKMVNRLVVQLTDANTAEATRKEILEKLRDLAPGIVRSLDNEGKATKGTADELRRYNDLMIEKIILSEKEAEFGDKQKKQAAAIRSREKSEENLINLVNKRIDSIRDEKQQLEAQRILYDEQFTLLEKIDQLRSSGYMQKEKSPADILAKGLNMDLEMLVDMRDPMTQAIQNYLKLMEVEREQKWTLNDLYKEIQETKGGMGLLMDGPYAPGFDPDASSGSAGMKKTSKELLQVLEETYQERMVKIEAQYAAEKISKQRYDAEMLAEELAYIQAQIVLKQKLKESTVDLELKYQEKLSSITEQVRQEYEALIKDSEKSYQDMQKEGQDYIDKMLDADATLADQKIEAQIRVAEAIQKIREDDLAKEQEATQKKAAIYQDLINTLSGAVYDFASDQENGMQNFIKSVANMALDLLKTQVEIAIAGVTIQSLASAESVASWGVAGLAKAALLVGLIEAAFAGVKGLVNSGISNMGKKDLWEGGYTPRGRWDQPQGVVHSDEFVANRHAVRNPQVRPILDVIDLAQRTGQIGSLNTDTILRAVEARRGGYAGGGYVQTAQPSAAPVASVDPELKILMAQHLKMIGTLNERLKYPLEADISYQRWKKRMEEMDEITRSVTMT